MLLGNARIPYTSVLPRFRVICSPKCGGLCIGFPKNSLARYFDAFGESCGLVPFEVRIFGLESDNQS